MLHEIGLALEKCRANYIKCNMNFSAFDVIIMFTCIAFDENVTSIKRFGFVK